MMKGGRLTNQFWRKCRRVRGSHIRGHVRHHLLRVRSHLLFESELELGQLIQSQERYNEW
jgi:hypothetical protein